jgi:hypothetical protein
MTTPVAAMSGVPVDLITALTTGSGIIAVPPSFRNHTIIIKTAAAVTSGAVQLETANEYDYSGTWAQVGGGPVTVVAATDLVINEAGVFNFLRARISTTIAGGGAPSVTVTYEGAKSY